MLGRRPSALFALVCVYKTFCFYVLKLHVSRLYPYIASIAFLQTDPSLVFAERDAASRMFRYCLVIAADKPIERSHVPTRDRLRCSRGLKTVTTGQRFLECFEGLQTLRRGYVKLRALVPGYQPTKASSHETTRAVMVAMNLLVLLCQSH